MHSVVGAPLFIHAVSKWLSGYLNAALHIEALAAGT